MVTFDKLVEVVRANTFSAVDDRVIQHVARETIKALGLCVSNSGEVYDPAPKPVINYPNDQNGVRYSGQQRRRRYRR